MNDILSAPPPAPPLDTAWTLAEVRRPILQRPAENLGNILLDHPCSIILH